MSTPKKHAGRGARKIQQRPQPPGSAGLTNENRPGLGTGRDKRRQPSRDTPPRSTAPEKEDDSAPSLPPTAPVNRPEPVEQDPASLEHEYERDTGVSGKSAGV